MRPPGANFRATGPRRKNHSNGMVAVRIVGDPSLGVGRVSAQREGLTPADTSLRMTEWRRHWGSGSSRLCEGGSYEGIAACILLKAVHPGRRRNRPKMPIPIDFSKLKRYLPYALMVIGAVLLVYVTVQYATMYSEQRRLAKEWERQNDPVVSATTPTALHDGLTKVTIPKINLDAVVVEGTNRKQLLLGPGHMKETAEPGELGNVVITAHRDTFFRHIYELNKGDNIEIRRNGKLFTYEVTGKKVVNPDDLSVIRQGKDKRLTLITCYPTYFIGPAPERLVVFSKLVEKGEDAKVVEVSSGGKE